VSDSEISGPWEIPSSWSWQYIGDVCDIIGGATPSTDDPRNFEGGDIPWVTPADLSGYREKFISRGARNITKAGLESSSTRLLPQGTVLFSSRAPVGYVAIATVPLATNQGFKSFVPPAGVASDYLFYYLKRAKSLALELASGTTFQEISGKRAGRIPLAIPPNNEQRRIVAKIEELLSDLDASVAALERARANLKRYRAAVLKAAVEGRLTAEWRKAHPLPAPGRARQAGEVEPADKLLERILAERRRKWEEAQLAKYAAQGKQPRKGWKDKYPEPAKPDTVNLPELPEGWCWATVDQLVIEPACNGISVRGSDSPPGVAALRLNAMTDRGFDFSRRRYIPLSEDVAQDLAIIEGDFFVSRGNGSLHLVGRGTLATTPQEVIVFPDTMIRLRFIAWGRIREYLARIWPSRFVRSQVEGKAKTSAGIYKISQSDLTQFIVSLPPIDEQEEIASRIDARLSVIEKVNEEIEQQLHRASRLRQAILKRAFEGKLVPPDPSDEPASVLLERIRNARAAEGTQRAHKRRKSPA